MVQDVDGVLNVWSGHFTRLGTPKHSPKFDSDHYVNVSRTVLRYNEGQEGIDPFLAQPFTTDEVKHAVKALNSGKAPGFDDVTAEHLRYGGSVVIELLSLLYNTIVASEYIPLCCRTGVQVPLYKGKDTCTLDPNNYRGITLLSVFNKVFEVLLWHRLEHWWVTNNIISELQFACKSCRSCVHTAYLLREAVAASLRDHGKCYVAFYDVAKAFDTVWIDGLFYQLWEMGIQGKTWRLLYRCYINFRCCVRIQGHVSGWYHLHCGIHQGGYMSLIKYTAFINSLIITLRNSGLCSKIYRMPGSPVGYADDLATCCRDRRKLERSMSLVCTHGRTWRYDFNAKKSGVLIFDNDITHNRRLPPVAPFHLGEERVPIESNYDHVGVKLCTNANDCSEIEERLAKARRALNAVAGIGIRKNGLNIASCSIIFWTIIVPIATFGAELWILNNKSVKVLENFQNFVGKKIQRLHSKAPNACSYFCLGWLRLERFIEVKKLLFIRSIMCLEGETIKDIFCRCAIEYYTNPVLGKENIHQSPLYDMLSIAESFRLNREVEGMVRRGHIWSKKAWSETVWARAWHLDEVFWCIQSRCHESLTMITNVSQTVGYSIWWQIADAQLSQMYNCETMVRLLSRSSKLRSDDVTLKRASAASRFCPLCELGALDDVTHLVMQCPTLQDIRNVMMNEISNLHEGQGDMLLNSGANILHMLMGKLPENASILSMLDLWLVAAKYIPLMYRKRLKEGVG